MCEVKIHPCEKCAQVVFNFNLYGAATPNFATFKTRAFRRQKWYFLLHKPEKLLLIQIGH